MYGVVLVHAWGGGHTEAVRLGSHRSMPGDRGWWPK